MAQNLATRTRQIFVAELDDVVGADLVDEPEVDADLVREPGDEVDADLVDEPEVDADLIGEPSDEVDADLDQDLDEDLDADEDESSACAPYLACQISFLGSRTPGVKDTPFYVRHVSRRRLGDTYFRENHVETSDIRTSKQHRDIGSLPRFRPPGG